MTSFPPSLDDGRVGPLPSLVTPGLQSLHGPERTVLVIGYPAPPAVQIVDRLLAAGARTVVCVVAGHLQTEATRTHREAQEAGRVRLFEGTAASPGLGLPHTAWRILDTTDEIYAVVSAREIAAGHIHDFADECPRLRELHVAIQSPDNVSRTRRVRRSLSRLRRSVISRLPDAATGTWMAALAAAGAALTTPVLRAVGAWKDLLDYDVEAALSWDDLEHDLWPSMRRTG